MWKVRLVMISLERGYYMDTDTQSQIQQRLEHLIRSFENLTAASFYAIFFLRRHVPSQLKRKMNKLKVMQIVLLLFLIAVGGTAILQHQKLQKEDPELTELREKSRNLLNSVDSLNNAIDSLSLVVQRLIGAETEVQKSPATFTLVDFSESKLVEILERRTGFIHKLGAKENRIAFDHSGSMRELSTGLVVYGGGHLEVSVDGRKCYSFRDLSLPDSPHFGNPREAVLRWLHEEKAKLIDAHSTVVANKVVECLSNF